MYYYSYKFYEQVAKRKLYKKRDYEMGNTLRKTIGPMSVIIILLLSLLLISPIANPEKNEPTKSWNDDWKFFQEIPLPIDTSLKQAQYQPIDMLITFKDPCWGINQTHHSIRIVCWNTTNWDELDV